MSTCNDHELQAVYVSVGSTFQFSDLENSQWCQKLFLLQQINIYFEKRYVTRKFSMSIRELWESYRNWCFLFMLRYNFDRSVRFCLSFQVKILLRVAGSASQEETDSGVSSWMTIDQRRKQVNLLDPSMIPCGGGAVPRSRSELPLAPKMFSFDSIFSPESTQSEIGAAALVDLVQAVVNGVDGCLISYGHAKLGKENRRKTPHVAILLVALWLWW